MSPPKTNLNDLLYVEAHFAWYSNRNQGVKMDPFSKCKKKNP